MAKGNKRGPKGPRIDDQAALRAMMPLIARGVKLATAAREVIRRELAPIGQSEQASIDRLRRKFRKHRQALVSERRSVGVRGSSLSSSLPPDRAATLDEIFRFLESEAVKAQVISPHLRFLKAIEPLHLRHLEAMDPLHVRLLKELETAHLRYLKTSLSEAASRSLSDPIRDELKRSESLASSIAALPFSLTKKS